MVAPKYMAELKKLPDDVLSFDAALYEVSSYKIKPLYFQLTVNSLLIQSTP